MERSASAPEKLISAITSPPCLSLRMKETTLRSASSAASHSNPAQESLLSGQLLIQILSMGIFAPLTEELIFRGLLYRRMKSLLSVGWSVILSSLLFAVYHGNMIQIVFAFPMALVLALLYEKSGRFCYPLLFHMGCNLTAIAVNCIR